MLNVHAVYKDVRNQQILVLLLYAWDSFHFPSVFLCMFYMLSTRGAGVLRVCCPLKGRLFRAFLKQEVKGGCDR